MKKMRIKPLIIVSLLVCSCTLEEVHDGMYCEANLKGSYADDYLSEPQLDVSTSVEITKTHYCPAAYPECSNETCLRCPVDKIWANRSDSESLYECISCDDLEDCYTKSCEEAWVRCHGTVRGCKAECKNGVLTTCNGSVGKTKCDFGCNEDGTACAETLTCRTGEIPVDNVCVCDSV